MKIEQLTGSLLGCWRAEKDGKAAYGQTKEEVLKLLSKALDK